MAHLPEPNFFATTEMRGNLSETQTLVERRQQKICADPQLSCGWPFVGPARRSSVPLQPDIWKEEEGGGERSGVAVEGLRTMCDGRA